MDPMYYEVVRIDGDYAYLKRTDIEMEELFFIAMALLPEGTTEGTKLRYELPDYEIIG